MAKRFRVWDEQTKSMIYFDFVDVQENRFSIREIASRNNWSNPIMEFITNVDGVDIYEQDIISDVVHGSEKRKFVADNIRSFVRQYEYSHHASVWKVIGNVFQNPELKEIN